MVRLKVFPRSEGVAPAPPEELAYVFNIDTAAESDLRRAVKDRLEKNIGSISPDQGKIKLVAPDGSLEDLRQKQSDLSESPWLYLVILLLLVGEQALAVHLSFHLKGGEAALPMAAQRARSAA
jgi:hypothetical protein